MATKTHNIGMRMNRKEPTRTFMMASNIKKSFSLHGLYKNNLWGLNNSKFKPWRSEAEHATSQSRRLLTILSLRVDGEEAFLFLSNRLDRETNPEL